MRSELTYARMKSSLDGLIDESVTIIREVAAGKQQHRALELCGHLANDGDGLVDQAIKRGFHTPLG